MWKSTINKKAGGSVQNNKQQKPKGTGGTKPKGGRSQFGDTNEEDELAPAAASSNRSSTKASLPCDQHVEPILAVSAPSVKQIHEPFVDVTEPEPEPEPVLMVHQQQTTSLVTLVVALGAESKGHEWYFEKHDWIGGQSYVDLIKLTLVEGYGEMYVAEVLVPMIPNQTIGYLRGRFALCANGWRGAVHVQRYEFLNREWIIPQAGKTISIVISDVQTLSYYGYAQNSFCSFPQQLSATFRLILFSADQLQQNDYTLQQFSDALSRDIAELQELHTNPPTFTVALDASFNDLLAQRRNVAITPRDFLKFLVLVTAMSKTAPTIQNILNPLFLLPTGFNPLTLLDVLEGIVEVTTVAKFLEIFIDNLLSYATKQATTVPWSILRSLIGVGSLKAGQVLTSNSNLVLSMMDKVPMRFRARLIDEMSRGLTSMTQLKRLIDLQGADGSFGVDNSLLRTILYSKGYAKPTEKTTAAVEEIEAMMHFLDMFAGTAHVVADIYALFASHPSFKISQVSGELSIEELAKLAVYPVLLSGVSPTVCLARVQEFCEAIKDTLVIDVKSAQAAYNVMRHMRSQLFAQVSCRDELLLMISDTMSTTTSPGFQGRLNAYFAEEDEVLVQLDRVALYNVFRLPATDPQIIRDYIKKNHFSAASQRAIDAVAILSDEIIERILRSNLEGGMRTICQLMNVSPSTLTRVEHLSVALLLSDAARTIRGSIVDEIHRFSQIPLVSVKYRQLQDLVSEAAMVLNKLADRMSNGLLTPQQLDLLVLHKTLSNLSSLIPTFNVAVVLEMKNRVQVVRDEWARLLTIFTRYMPQHPRFIAASDSFTSEIQQKLIELEKTEIVHWRSPSIGGQHLVAIAEKLTKAKESVIFDWFWSTTCNAEASLPPVNELELCLEEWRLSVLRTFDAWFEFCLSIQRQDCLQDRADAVLSRVLENIPGCPDLAPSVLEATTEFDHFKSDLERHITSKAELEASLAMIVLVSSHQLQKEDMITSLKLYLMAKASAATVAVCALKLGEVVNANINTIHPVRLFANALSDSTVTIRIVNELYQALTVNVPTLFRIVPRFAVVLLDTILEHSDGGIFRIFTRYDEEIDLNKSIGRLMNNDVDGHAQQMLIALKDVWRAFNGVAESKPLFNALRSRSMPDFAQLIEYVANISWCITPMKCLKGGIAKLVDLIDERGTTASALASARAVLSGQINISLPNGTLFAESDAFGVTKKIFTADELGDIPFQLCLVGNAKVSEDDKVHKQRQQFLFLIETVNIIAQLLREIAESGHPDYQSKTLVIAGCTDKAELLQVLEEYRTVAQGWRSFLEDISSKFPLLCCLSRKQLVKSFLLIRSPNVQISQLIEFIRGAFTTNADTETFNESLQQCFESQTFHHRNDDLQSSAAAVHSLFVAASSFILPRKGAFELSEQLLVDVQSLKSLLPQDMQDLTLCRAPIVFWRLAMAMAGDQLHGILCSLYLATMRRFPNSLEVLVCSGETSEHELLDFIQRWSVSYLFPGDDTDTMFCIFEATKLPPALQNIIVTFASSCVKRDASRSLVLLGAAQEGEANASIICSALRNITLFDERNFAGNWFNLLKGVLHDKMANIFVCRSAAPLAGKTTTILRQFCASDKNRVCSSFSLSNDFSSAIKIIGSSNYQSQAMGLTEDDEMLMHINVTNTVDANCFNLFMLAFIIMGRLVGTDDIHALRRKKDIVVIEWPSEGIIADRAWERCPLLSCFNCINVGSITRMADPDEQQQLDSSQSFPLTGIHLDELKFVPLAGEISNAFTDDSFLYNIQIANDEQFKLGLQLAIAYLDVPAKALILPYHSTIVDVDISEPHQLFLRLENYLKRPGSPFPDVGLVYRFARFLGKQLYGLYSYELYKVATPDLEAPAARESRETNVKNYRKLAYYYAKHLFELAQDLAATAVRPMTDADCNEDTRLSELSLSFEDWNQKFFLIFSSDGHPEIISANHATNGNSFLEELCRSDPDSHFQRFLKLHSANRSSASIVTLCAKLSSEGYNPLTEQTQDHALRVLLPLLGSKPYFGVNIFEALSRMHLPAGDEAKKGLSMNSFIVEFKKWHSSAVETLNSMINVEDVITDDMTVSSFVKAADTWIHSIKGSYLDHDSAPFVLTVYGLVRLLVTKLRLNSRIPMIFMGETGNGKTHLISFFSRATGNSFEVITLHGGMRAEDLLFELQGIIQRNRNREVTVLLDEINSMVDVWYIKEVVCDRMLLGRRLPDNIQFVCIMNPYRRLSKHDEGTGFDYSSSPLAMKEAQIQQADQRKELPLVYQVSRSPESVMRQVTDFGSPSRCCPPREVALEITQRRTPFAASLANISDETIFAENIVYWMSQSQFSNFQMDEESLFSEFRRCDHAENDGLRHLKFVRSLLCSLFDFSQNFIRSTQQETSAASLRDINRTVSLIPFLVDLQQRLLKYDPGWAANENYLFFTLLQRAIFTSFVVNYSFKLDRQTRQRYFSEFKAVWESVRNDESHRHSISDYFLPAPADGSFVYKAFDDIAVRFCDCLVLDSNMAINESLKENVFSLYCSIMANLDGGSSAQFIVGRPGSSKSSSLDILCASTDPSCTDRRAQFFREIGSLQIEKFVLQCTPDTTAYDILRLARKAALLQRRKSQTCRFILVLEEVGVTVGSKHNPLMVLHSLIDKGVKMEDGTYVRLIIIGISNWKLDSSKMNRMRITYRGNPSLDDLMKTAKCIMSNVSVNVSPREAAEFNRSLTQFAQVFSDLMLSNDQHDPILRDIGWFYGMRDFYAFIQMVQFHRAKSLANEVGANEFYNNGTSFHLIQWAAKVNFGGHIRPEREQHVINEIVKCFFPAGAHSTQTAYWQRASSGVDRSLCDMCARAVFYGDIRTLSATTVPATSRQQLERFHATTKKLNHNVNCVGILDNKATSISIMQVLAYCLHSRPEIFAQYRVRHLLLFTKANAALQLLYSLNLVKQSSSVIIFGRSNPSAREILDDLLLVRRCMIAGGVLILVGAQHIYESLYDALNQHYSVEGTGMDRKFFTRLTMNGYTTSFPLHCNFRCIVIEQEASSDRLLPPFLNRFVKASLNFSVALTVEQSNLARYLLEQAQVMTDDKKGSVNILPILIPGFCDDTLDSLAFQFSSEQLQSNFEGCKQEALNRLKLLTSPRRLLQLCSGLYKNLKSDTSLESLKRWQDIDDREYTLTTDSVILNKAYRRSPLARHIVVFTELRNVDWETIRDAVQQSLPVDSQLVPSNPVNVNRINSSKEIEQLLTELNSHEGNAHLIAAFDTTNASGKDFTNQFERFMHAFSNECYDNRKVVVLICVVANSSKPGGLDSNKNSKDGVIDELQLHMDSKWKYIFVDEIDDLRDDEQECAIYSLSELILNESSLALHLQFDGDIIFSIIGNQIVSLVQSIQISGNRLVDYDQAEQIFEALLSDPTEAIQEFAMRVLKSIQSIDGLGYGAWQRAALIQVKYADSLRLQLTEYIMTVVKRVFVEYCDVLFMHANYRHALPDSPLSNVFATLVQSSIIVPERDVTMCAGINLGRSYKLNRMASNNVQRQQQPIDVDEEVDSNEEEEDVCMFPFSVALYNYLAPLVASTHNEEALEEKIKSSLSLPADLSTDDIELYAHDVLLFIKNVKQMETRCAFMNILRSIRGNSPLSIASFHFMLEFKRDFVAAALNYLSCKVIKVSSLQVTIEPENFEAALILAATTNSVTGLVTLDCLGYIETMTGNSSLVLQLMRAFWVATVDSTTEARTQAVSFLYEIIDNVNQFSSNNILALAEQITSSLVGLRLAKHLFPVVFKNIGEEKGRLIVSLLHQMKTRTGAISVEAWYFLLREALSFLLESNDDHYNNDIVKPFTEIVINIQGGVTSSNSILLSRCVFDATESVVHFKAYRGRVLRLFDASPIVRKVLLSGLITSGLETLASNIKTAAETSRSSLEAHECQDIVRALEEDISDAGLGDVAALYFLRVSTFGGVEVEFARKALRDNHPRIHLLLPTCIANHPKVVEFCAINREQEPFAMMLVDNFNVVLGVVDEVLRNDSNVAATTADSILQRLQDAFPGGPSAMTLFAVVIYRGYLKPLADVRTEKTALLLNTLFCPLIQPAQARLLALKFVTTTICVR